MCRYSQGIASDGPVILYDGLPITPDEIVELLNKFVIEIKQLQKAKKEVFKYLEEHYLTFSSMGEIDTIWDAIIKNYNYKGEEYLQGRSDVTEELKEKIDAALDWLRGRNPEEAYKILSAVREMLE